MQFLVFVLLICLFIFLFCVYCLAKDDLILLRKDVSMERLFNIIMLGSLICVFAARLFYGLFHAKNILLNPFVFLLFPYFPGLSLLGGVFGGGAVFLFLRARQKNKLPLGRLADFFSIAFLITLPIGVLGYAMLAEVGFSAIRAGSIIVVYVVLFIAFLRFLLPQLMRGKLKEGTIAILFLTCFSAVSLISNAVPKLNILDFFKNPENLILILVFLLSIGLLVRQESLLLKINKFKRKN